MSTEPVSTAQPSTELQTISIEIEIKTPLTEEQQKILSFVYDSAKDIGAEIFNKSNVSDALKVTQLVGSVIKIMESLTFNQAKVSGLTKKTVGLALGRKLICDLIKEDAVRTSILTLYDATADAVLEAMIDVSRNVNVTMEQVTSCCTSLFDLLKKK